MRSAKKQGKRFGFLLAVGVSLLLCLAMAASASAAKRWQIDSLTKTTAQPGDILDYKIQVTSVGDEVIGGEPAKLRVSLPDGFTVTDPDDPAVGPGGAHFKVSSGFPLNFQVVDFGAGLFSCAKADETTPLSGGESEVFCESFVSGGPRWQVLHLPVDVSASLAPGETRTAEITIEGGGASATIADVTRIAAGEAEFGIDSHDGAIAKEDGSPFTQAGGHPYVISNSIDFNSILDLAPQGGAPWPAEPNRDVVVDLPAGLVGNPAALAQCTAGELAFNGGAANGAVPLCPTSSQVGGVFLRVQYLPGSTGPIPLFNMVPPPGAAPRYAFNYNGSLIMLDAVLRQDGEYRLAVQSRNIPEVLALTGTTVSFWGTPADPSHTYQRACPGQIPPTESDMGPTCASDGAQVPFLRMPTSCTPVADGLEFNAHTDSWVDPGPFDAKGVPVLSDPAWVSKAFKTHLPPT